MVKARTYVETLVLWKMNLALQAGDDCLLAHLDEIREVAGLPIDQRVSQRFHRQLCQALREPAR